MDWASRCKWRTSSHPLGAELNELLIDAVLQTFCHAPETSLSADGPVSPTDFRLVYSRP